MTTQTLTLDQCPPDIRAFFLNDHGFQADVRVTKSSPASATPAPVTKTLKTSRPQHVQKAANLPGFAQILGASIERDVGTPPPPVKIAPVQPVQSIAGPIPESTPPNVGKPITRAFNTPKEPLRAERGNPVEFASLRAAIDSALHEQRQREASERFNAGRSAFSRIAPTTKSDVQGGGSGNAWGLRNLGGRLAASVLNGTTRKADHKPVGSSALDVAFGRGR